MAAFTGNMALRVVVFDENLEDARELAEAIEKLDLASPLDVMPLSKLAELSMRLSVGIDILVMDLGKPGEPYDGIDILRTLVGDDSVTRVILTGSQKGAHRRAYLVDHLWYLPKPIDELELRDALEKALGDIEKDRERPLLVLSGRSDVVIRPGDVRFVESRLRVVRIHERERVVDIYGKLSDIAALLPAHFVRCHGSCLVNLDFAQRLGPDGLELVDGEVVPVSRRHHAATREALLAHYGSRVPQGLRRVQPSEAYPNASVTYPNASKQKMVAVTMAG